MAGGHSIKISVETYAHVILAAKEARQTISQWMEAAARDALARQDREFRVAQYRTAQQRAADLREPAPLPADFGLAPRHP